MGCSVAYTDRIKTVSNRVKTKPALAVHKKASWKGGQLRFGANMRKQN